MRNIKSPFGAKIREVVGIDFSVNTLRLCFMRMSRQKKELVSVKIVPTTGLADADIVKAILDFYSGTKARAPEIITVISSQVVITKNIEVPSVNPQEIKEIISLQAGRHTPYSREEVIVDHIDIGVYKKNYTKILMVIINSKIVRKQLEMLEKAGLRIKKVLFAPEGLAWASNRILRLESHSAPVGLIHIDSDFTDFNVILKGRVIFVRSIPIGRQHLVSDNEKSLVKFSEEVRKSLEAYQNEDIERNVERLFISGAVEGVADFENILGEAFGLPVKVVSYAKGIVSSPAVQDFIAKEKDYSLFSLICGLLACDEVKVNLIPEELKLKQVLEQRGRDLALVGMLFLAAFTLVFFIMLTRIYFKGAYLNVLNDKYLSLNKDTLKLEKELVGINTMRKYFSGQGSLLEVIRELSQIMPEDLEFSDIRADEQGRLTTKGTALSMSTVFSFVDSMAKSKYFKEVKTKYTTKRKEAGKDIVDFEINCLLKKVAGH
ncbi:MAG: pilus assembly protein PilM [Candidatus Omnitrophica bacterium]|jgi:Tfp pilus assembly PilM family ATPase|nr:pilus assembly protein PilM [Candidatus Omnitrophota bacterium]MDD5078755.1 pilus assembly protein PilM [Candidatus Omnitrophota bacterium]